MEVQPVAPKPTALNDWRLLLRLNDLVKLRGARGQSSSGVVPPPEAVRGSIREAENALASEIAAMDLPFRFPTLDLLAVLSPEPVAPCL